MKKVKHKKGSFQEQWYVNLYFLLLGAWYIILYQTRLKRKTKVFARFTKESIDDMGGSENIHDWKKLFGTKSGIDTKTNNEEIAVYRTYPMTSKTGDIAGIVETGKYIRNGNDFKVFDKESKYIYQEGETEMEVEIEMKHWLPVSPWAGGNEKPYRPFWFLLWAI